MAEELFPFLPRHALRVPCMGWCQRPRQVRIDRGELCLRSSDLCVSGKLNLTPSPSPHLHDTDIIIAATPASKGLRTIPSTKDRGHNSRVRWSSWLYLYDYIDPFQLGWWRGRKDSWILWFIMILHNDGLMFWNTPRSLYMTFFLSSRYYSVCLASVFGFRFPLDGLNDHNFVFGFWSIYVCCLFFSSIYCVGRDTVLVDCLNTRCILFERLGFVCSV